MERESITLSNGQKYVKPEKGGLGIKNIRKMNISLLVNWWWKLETEDGLWQDIVKAKYVKGKPIGAIKSKINDFPIWSNLLKVRHYYLQGRKCKLGDGKSIRFWQDSWLSDTPLCISFHELFELCKDPDITVAECANNGWVVEFKRHLSNYLHNQWYMLADQLNQQAVSQAPDTVSWKCGKSGKYTTKSLYNHMTKDESGESHRKIWKAKIPEKIKNFMWLLENRDTLTKDNMLRKNWLGDLACYFCDQYESIDHLFFICPIAKVIWCIVAMCFGISTRPRNMNQYWKWINKICPGRQDIQTIGLSAICWSIWKRRNKACFKKVIIKHPCDIIFQSCAFLKCWTSLVERDLKDILKTGVMQCSRMLW